MALGQLLGQLAQGTASTVDLEKRKLKKHFLSADKNQEEESEESFPISLPSYLDVLHVLKEVRLWVVIVCELDEVPELFFGGKGLHKAGQYGGVIMLHTLVE